MHLSKPKGYTVEVFCVIRLEWSDQNLHLSSGLSIYMCMGPYIAGWRWDVKSGSQVKG